MKKKLLSLLLVLCMLLSMLPVNVLAAELGTLGTDVSQVLVPDDQLGILYSDAELTVTADSYLAEGGSYAVTLTRSKTDDEASFTVVVYDNSTSYGKDYCIVYDGETVQKIEGTNSVYDAFRDNGELTSGLAFELAVTSAMTENAGEEQQDVSASAILAQLDELSAKVAAFPVYFAAGEDELTLYIEVIDDAVPEYEETFLLAVLDADDEAVAGAQQAFAIVDNDSSAPSVSVRFDCEDVMELTDEAEAAELCFRRTGDLATTTLVTLYVDGEPYGQVDFAPWQEIQTVDAVVAGVYTLDGSDTQVEVIDNTTAEMTMAEGADPVLDAIPDEYAVIRTPHTGDLNDTSWVPAWATGAEGSNEKQNIVLGTTTDNLFEAGYTSGVKGSLTFYEKGYNIHNISTSGTGSGSAVGKRNMDSKAAYDMTGVESVETTFQVSGLDHEGEYGVRLSKQSWQILALNHDKNGDTSVHTVTVPVDEAYRTSSQKVYFSNVDPSDGTCRGTEMYVPNALKFNLRTYRFRIEGTPSEMGGANNHMVYTHSLSNGEIKVPTINGSTATQYLTINSYDYTGKTVNICYTSQDLYPAKLVGYKLMAENGDLSELIELGSDMQTSDSIGFVLDKDFLKKYESKYCYYEKSSLDGSYWTFHIIPIYEKIEITSREIIESTDGTLKLVEDSNYLGDKWVFTATDEAAAENLAGVWYEAKKTLSDSIKHTGIAMTRYSEEHQHWFVLDVDYPIYKVQGIFSTETNKLTVEYDPEREYEGRGVLEQSGTVVSAASYIVGDYVPLIAHRADNSKYVTRWHVKGTKDYVYGDVYYYQLDGNPLHNTIYVEFVPLGDDEGLKVESLTMNLAVKKSDVEVRPGGYSRWVELKNAVITMMDDNGTVHTAVTDENGKCSMPNFVAVKGKYYSASVEYDGAVIYDQFMATGDGTLNVRLPQFGTGVPYPDQVSASVNGLSATTNAIELSKNCKISATTQVYVPEKGYTITGVKYYFVTSNYVKEGVITAASKEYDAAHVVATDSGNFQTWSVTIDTATDDALCNGQHLYVEVFYDKTVYQNGENGKLEIYTTPMSSGLVDTGYAVANAGREEETTVSHEIPSTPSMQNTAFGGDLSKINIPVLGKLDLSLSSKTGGFFAQRVDAAGNTTLLCGSSWLANFGTGTVAEKLDAKRKTDKALAAAEDTAKAGAANADVTAISGEPTGSDVLYTAKVPSKWTFNPAYLFKFTFSPKTDGSNDSYISRFEMALGVDANYIRNIPFSVYGVPFYVCLTFTTEAYFDVQAEFAESRDLQIGDVTQDLITTSGKNQDTTTVESFIAAPVFNIGVKGGVGYNGFLSLYLTASVSAPFIIEVYPNVIGAFSLAATVGFGADLVLFSAQISETIDVGTLAYNDEIKKELEELTPIGKKSTRSADVADLDLEMEQLQQAFDEATFAPMLRTALRRAATNNATGTVASDVFKNTGVHLLKQDEDTIYAFYLQDNKLEDTLNYLTVTYAESNDGGETWTDRGYISDNTQEPYTSLQFDIHLFELDDCTLITWSEANFDEVLKNLGDVDINKLTPAQISKFMNAMNLKGCLFNKETGEPIGETFTIAENSTVACGALDAVQNGDMVYVYYQRNVYPYDETAGEITLEQLLSTDRTIAMARASVDDTSEWISTTVRATKANQEYRITEVEPFVHDGVMGEILVLDRDGKLATWDEESGTWVASNEDRQLYLRTYTFGEDGAPIPSALMAITDPNVCAQSPQVVSNDDYLHLFWNQNGKIVYQTDFAATYKDHADVQEGAYVVLNANGSMSETSLKGNYYANDIAYDDAHIHMGTTFSASMDESGNVLLSWVATDSASTELTDEVYGVVLQTVTNAEAQRLSGSELAGSKNVYQLYAKGSPVALTDESSLISALDSVFLGNEIDGNSSFLLVFSKLDKTTRQLATSADLQAQRSEYQAKLAITDISAPSYPMPGSDMSVAITVKNNGLGEAKNVSVSASGIGNDATGTISSILPGCSETIELTVAVPDTFRKDTTMTVTANDATASFDVLYGPYFVVKHMPEMSNLTGTSDYTTATQVYNAGNAPGIPTLHYEVSIFASDEKGKEYTYTADEELGAGETTILNYVLEDTPITQGKTGTLTITVDTERDLDAYQYIQGQMPQLKIRVTKSDLDLDDSGEDDPVDPKPEDPKPEDPKPEDPKPGLPSTPSFFPGTIIPTKPNTDSKDLPSDDVKSDDSPSDDAENVSGEGQTDNTSSTELPFDDVKSDDWFYDDVEYVYNEGLMNGTGKNFEPNGVLTRAMVVTILYRMEVEPETMETFNTFSDISGSDWYGEAVEWAAMNGIVNGYSDGRFGPNDAITREQLATILYRYAAYKGYNVDSVGTTLDSFPDAASVSAYAVTAMQWAVDKGLINGISGKLCPQDTATRAQVAAIIHRFLANLPL